MARFQKTAERVIISEKRRRGDRDGHRHLRPGQPDRLPDSHGPPLQQWILSALAWRPPVRSRRGVLALDLTQTDALPEHRIHHRVDA
jgi:hypothetical protein